MPSCKVGKPVVVDVLNGYNGTVLAYGQTVLPAILVGKAWTTCKSAPEFNISPDLPNLKPPVFRKDI